MRLGVNIDHVATLRQQRHTRYPDIVAAAHDAEQGGADLITVHLREDRRHIQDKDVFKLKESVKYLNLEMAATDEMLEVALQVKPYIVCLVPEKRAELTTEGGLDVASQMERLGKMINTFYDNSILVSLFVDPDKKQIEAAREIHSWAVEIHTGSYAEATDPCAHDKEFKRIKDSAALAKEIGLKVHAGHGLDYINVKEVAKIPEIEELNIGHSIVSRALFVGIEQATRDMALAMRSGKE